MSYFIALGAIVLGGLMVIKTEWFLSTFGPISWAEQHLGTEGGSRLMYKLLGLLFIILAILGVTGALGNIILSFFGPLFGGPR